MGLKEEFEGGEDEDKSPVKNDDIYLEESVTIEDIPNFLSG